MRSLTTAGLIPRSSTRSGIRGRGISVAESCMAVAVDIRFALRTIAAGGGVGVDDVSYRGDWPLVNLVLMSTTTAIQAPRGNAITCKGWHQEAALRMLHNNLD